MTDRWNSKLRTVDVVRPPKFFVPGGSSSSGGSVVPRGKTWGIRERGDIGGTVVHAYRCPVHGLFELEVPRADVPEHTFCEHRERPDVEPCNIPATWAGSFCGQGHAAGEVES